jgi:hypothetical protein
MLNRIDQRLGKLESFIIPIHHVTQKLTKVEESMNWCRGRLKAYLVSPRITGINQGKGQVDNVLNLHEVVEAERSIISPG